MAYRILLGHCWAMVGVPFLIFVALLTSGEMTGDCATRLERPAWTRHERPTPSSIKDRSSGDLSCRVHQEWITVAGVESTNKGTFDRIDVLLGKAGIPWGLDGMGGRYDLGVPENQAALARELIEKDSVGSDYWILLPERKGTKGR